MPLNGGLMRPTATLAKALDAFVRRGQLRPIDLAGMLWPRGHALTKARSAGALLARMKKAGYVQVIPRGDGFLYAITKLGLEARQRAQMARVYTRPRRGR